MQKRVIMWRNFYPRVCRMIKGRLTIVFGGPQGGLKSMFFYIFESGKKLKVGEILFLPL